MISNLKISNYALIENLEISFISGYITITGETGAGKSILMGALSLILGQRADSSVLLKKDQKCIVEGLFKINEIYRPFFEENDIDFEKDSILRREILPGGKSRAFINDTPVTLSLLKALGDQLVDIHSQHQSLQLNDQLYQLQVVDFVSGNDKLLKEYQALYSEYGLKRAELTKHREEIAKISGELDFFRFQYDELLAAQLKTDELQLLEEEIRQLEHAEEIKLALKDAGVAIEGDGQILNILNEAVILQKRISKLHSPSAGFAERLESAYIELKDVATEMLSLAERTEHNPERLEQARDRVDLIYRLLQKHRVKEVGELIDIREQLNQKITAITFSDDLVNRLNKEVDHLLNLVKKSAEELHAIRQKTGKFIEKEIAAQLVQLGIPNASFVVKTELTEQPGKYGMDNIRFLFSANKQSPVEDIAKVASGGEISRLMLSIKSMLSDYKGLPTLIFDEIDSGVSGEIADKMGAIMKRMSGGRQVIAITHLPQVASQGEEHFLVYKQDTEESTVTHIRKLNRDERVIEIAKLLSGEKLTDAAISNAKELLRI